MKTNNKNYFKITDNGKLKTSEILKKCKDKFPVWCYWNDEKLDVNFPAPKKSITRYFKKNVEADEENANKSYNDLEKEGVIKDQITLRERLLMELQYFKETGKHLDVANITLCVGSRYANGYVPRVCWGGGGVRVDWYDPGGARGSLRGRSAVSLKSLFSETCVNCQKLQDKLNKIKEYDKHNECSHHIPYGICEYENCKFVRRQKGICSKCGKKRYSSVCREHRKERNKLKRSQLKVKKNRGYMKNINKFMTNQNKKEKCSCNEPHISDTVVHRTNGLPCYIKEKVTPPSKSSSWEVEFFERFGANKIWVVPSKENVETILDIHSFFYKTILSERADERKERDNYWQKVMENTCIVGRNFPARCYECGEKHASGMSWEEAYRANALFGKCFKCVSKQAISSN